MFWLRKTKDKLYTRGINLFKDFNIPLRLDSEQCNHVLETNITKVLKRNTCKNVNE